MSYELLKWTHLFSLLNLFFVIGGTHSGSNPRKKMIISGVLGILVMMTGMILMPKIGLSHADGFPGWIIIKLTLILILLIGYHITCKRFPKKIGIWKNISLVIGALAIFFAVWKP